jgi:hypothetical protein
MQSHWAAGLLGEQVLEAVQDLHGEIEGGVCQGPFGAEKSTEVFDAAIARLSDLQGWLERIGCGHADGPIEVPLSVLFPGERG